MRVVLRCSDFLCLFVCQAVKVVVGFSRSCCHLCIAFLWWWSAMRMRAGKEKDVHAFSSAAPFGKRR